MKRQPRAGGCTGVASQDGHQGPRPGAGASLRSSGEEQRRRQPPSWFLRTHAHSHSYTLIHAHTRTHSHTYTLMPMFTNTPIYIYTHACTLYTHSHKYIHTHTHTDTLTQTDASPPHHPFRLTYGEKEWEPNVTVLNIYYYYRLLPRCPALGEMIDRCVPLLIPTFGDSECHTHFAEDKTESLRGYGDCPHSPSFQCRSVLRNALSLSPAVSSVGGDSS